MPIGVITVAVTATAAVLAVQVHLLVIVIRRLQELELHESQTLMFPASDSVDVGSSPCPSMMDMQDQLLLPVGFSSFESFNQPPPPSVLNDSLSKHQEVIKSAAVANQVNSTSASIAGEFDHLIKAEALMSFSPMYGAVETPTGELPFDFQESLCYEIPGSGDCTTRHDTGSILQSKKHYTHIESGKEKNNDKLSGYVRSCATRETQVALSPFSAFNSTNSVKGMSRFSGSSSRNQSQGEAVVTGDNLSIKSEMKKKEIIPVRIAGDIDGGLLDGTLNAPVGVWRSVGVSKGMKQPTAWFRILPLCPA
ncbi:hypothetical protein CQW23_09017 [Capsicum baccatum]|uniref:Mediator of RNA polymerase II transcription subunit 13 n=1 Tax=Capsicum baccatum TaxID=33114 RepID=A0A2G2XAP7_CAPBA|nr:hypothetical protein CQW23_09017 [Capsicum baccatum]